LRTCASAEMQQTGVAEANKRQGRGKDAIKRSLFSYFPPSPLEVVLTQDHCSLKTMHRLPPDRAPIYTTCPP
jgi:hypothetical protein